MKTIISLCDYTGIMVKPWVDAGYYAILVDPQHIEQSVDGLIERIPMTLLDAMPRIGEIIRTHEVVFVAGFPPCTDVAVSGARWFDEKSKKDKYFQAKAALVAKQCRCIALLSGAPGFLKIQYLYLAQYLASLILIFTQRITQVIALMITTRRKHVFGALMAFSFLKSLLMNH